MIQTLSTIVNADCMEMILKIYQYIYYNRYNKISSGNTVVYLLILLIEITAAQNEVALTYHRVRGLYFLGVIRGCKKF